MQLSPGGKDGLEIILLFRISLKQIHTKIGLYLCPLQPLESYMQHLKYSVASSFDAAIPVV